MQNRSMTSSEWHTSNDPIAMLDFVRNDADRLFRLFAAACCRRVWPLLIDAESREAVLVSEALADNRIDAEAHRAAARAAGQAKALRNHDATSLAAEGTAALLRGKPTYSARKCSTSIGLAQAVVDSGDPLLATDSMAWEGDEFQAYVSAENSFQTALIRDLFGDPFAGMPTVDANWSTWNSGAIPGLCLQMYESRSFDDMVFLEVMLREAGCRDERVIEHCRMPVHARGCWLVDLLLGRR
jgi:hypothetical protein